MFLEKIQVEMPERIVKTNEILNSQDQAIDTSLTEDKQTQSKPVYHLDKEEFPALISDREIQKHKRRAEAYEMVPVLPKNELPVKKARKKKKLLVVEQNG